MHAHVCVCMCVCMCVHLCVGVQMYVCACMHACMCACICKRMHVCVHMCKCACLHECRMCVCACAYVYAHVCMCMHACFNVCLHMYIRMRNKEFQTSHPGNTSKEQIHRSGVLSFCLCPVYSGLVSDSTHAQAPPTLCMKTPDGAMAKNNASQMLCIIDLHRAVIPASVLSLCDCGEGAER